MSFYAQCWNYPRPNALGYGRHRQAYEVLVGPIPPKHDLDHLCRNRACYNPTHLEPVTRSVNLKRGFDVRLGPDFPCGHPRTIENCRPYKLQQGSQECAECHRARNHRKEEKAA